MNKYQVTIGEFNGEFVATDEIDAIRQARLKHHDEKSSPEVRKIVTEETELEERIEELLGSDEGENADKKLKQDKLEDVPVDQLGLSSRVVSILEKNDPPLTSALVIRNYMATKSLDDIEGIGPQSVEQIVAAVKAAVGLEPTQDQV